MNSTPRTFPSAFFDTHRAPNFESKYDRFSAVTNRSSAMRPIWRAMRPLFWGTRPFFQKPSVTRERIRLLDNASRSRQASSASPDRSSGETG